MSHYYGTCRFCKEEDAIDVDTGRCCECGKSEGDYAIALQRAIEYHTKGDEVPERIAKDCPHHAEMLNKSLGQHKS